MGSLFPEVSPFFFFFKQKFLYFSSFHCSAQMCLVEGAFISPKTDTTITNSKCLVCMQLILNYVLRWISLNRH